MQRPYVSHFTRFKVLFVFLECKVDLFVGDLDTNTKDTYTSNTPQVKHDNTMSALRLQPGCCVTLFDLPNYEGASKTTCNTMNFKQLKEAFGIGWNDKVSSLQLHSGKM